MPFKRELRVSSVINSPQLKLSKTYCPNFYSSTLCRKSNNSHILKQKGGRILGSKPKNLLLNKGDSEEALSDSFDNEPAESASDTTFKSFQSNKQITGKSAFVLKTSPGPNEICLETSNSVPKVDNNLIKCEIMQPSPTLNTKENKSNISKQDPASKKSGVCSFCSITMCELCIKNKAYCHSIDNRRSLYIFSFNFY